jgi:hypothetical protein
MQERQRVLEWVLREAQERLRKCHLYLSEKRTSIGALKGEPEDHTETWEYKLAVDATNRLGFVVSRLM